MQSLLAKLAAFGVIVGGFAATGDLRRLAERGTRLVNATTVPVEAAPPAPGSDRGPPPSGPSHPEPVVSPAQPAPAPAEARDAPVGHPVSAARLPVSTLESINLRTLSPGKRLAVWVGTPPALVAFDIVDPASGEVLEQQLTQAGGAPHAIPRRVRLEGDASRPRQIVRGGSLRLLPLGIAHGASPAGPAETLGPVRAIEVQ
ncbi:MAG: hypothetical protein WCR51_06780 [Planctomycetia bacterium]